MGNKSQPNNIRSLKGDHNKDRYAPDGVNAKLLEEVPAPPEWLVELDNLRDDKYSSVDAFNKKASWLVAHKLITDGDIDMLAMLSALEVAMILKWLDGREPSMSQYTQYKAFASEFGLTTISRERIRGADAGGAKNRFKGRKRK